MKKKIYLSFLLVIMLVTLTGCGKNNKDNNSTSTTEQKVNTKKLSCTISEKEKKYTKSLKIVLNYTNEKLSKSSIAVTYDYTSGKYDSKEAKKIAEACTKALKNKGVTCSSSSSGSKINSSYDFTIDKMDETSMNLDSYKALKGFDEVTYDLAKVALESDGYLCN